MKIHFITFGDSTSGGLIPANTRMQAAARLCDQIQETDWVYSSKNYNLEIIKYEFPNWYNDNINFILNNQRGCGYWIWKSFIIAETLRLINNGDILIYADSGYEISKSATKRFNEYISYTEKHHLLAFEVNESIEKWSKFDLLHYFGAHDNPNILNQKQIQAGLIFIKKNIKTTFFINSWQTLSLIHNYHFINDACSYINENSNKFIEHRHDQSIFSLILRCNEFGYIIEDEAFTPELFALGKYDIEIPFQCLRNPSGIRFIRD